MEIQIPLDFVQFSLKNAPLTLEKVIIGRNKSFEIDYFDREILQDIDLLTDHKIKIVFKELVSMKNEEFVRLLNYKAIKMIEIDNFVKKKDYEKTYHYLIHKKNIKISNFQCLFCSRIRSCRMLEHNSEMICRNCVSCSECKSSIKDMKIQNCTNCEECQSFLCENCVNTIQSSNDKKKPFCRTCFLSKRKCSCLLDSSISFMKSCKHCQKVFCPTCALFNPKEVSVFCEGCSDYLCVQCANVHGDEVFCENCTFKLTNYPYPRSMLKDYKKNREVGKSNGIDRCMSCKKKLAINNCDGCNGKLCQECSVNCSICCHKFCKKCCSFNSNFKKDEKIHEKPNLKYLKLPKPFQYQETICVLCSSMTQSENNSFYDEMKEKNDHEEEEIDDDGEFEIVGEDEEDSYEIDEEDESSDGEFDCSLRSKKKEREYEIDTDSSEYEWDESEGESENKE